MRFRDRALFYHNLAEAATFLSNQEIINIAKVIYKNDVYPLLMAEKNITSQNVEDVVPSNKDYASFLDSYIKKFEKTEPQKYEELMGSREKILKTLHNQRQMIIQAANEEERKKADAMNREVSQTQNLTPEKEAQIREKYTSNAKSGIMRVFGQFFSMGFSILMSILMYKLIYPIFGINMGGGSPPSQNTGATR